MGTFGVGSAGYWWGGAGTAFLRRMHCLTPRQLALWLMLHTDEGRATVRGPSFEMPLVFHLFRLAVLLDQFISSGVKGGIGFGWPAMSASST